MAVVWKLLMPHSVLLYPGDCGGGIHLNVLANSTVSNSEVVGNRQGASSTLVTTDTKTKPPRDTRAPLE